MNHTNRHDHNHHNHEQPSDRFEWSDGFEGHSHDPSHLLKLFSPKLKPHRDPRGGFIENIEITIPITYK